MTTTTMIIAITAFFMFEIIINPLTREKAREREDRRRKEKAANK